MATSILKINKICEWCGSAFEAQKISTRYCSHKCGSRANKDRKRRERKQKAEDAVRQAVAQREIDEVKDLEYLSVKQAATLLNFSRDGVYKLIKRGTLKAHRISKRCTVILKKEIDNMLANATIDPSAVAAPTTQDKEFDSITEFYTTQEVMEIFGISNSWLFKVGKQRNIHKIFHHGKTLWNKKQCQSAFGDKNTNDVAHITEWYTTDEICEKFGITKTRVYGMAYDSQIPKKKEKGVTYYSKLHVDVARGVAEPEKTLWYTLQEAREVFSITSDQLKWYRSRYNITTKKEGNTVYLSRSEMDSILAHKKQ